MAIASFVVLLILAIASVTYALIQVAGPEIPQQPKPQSLGFAARSVQWALENRRIVARIAAAPVAAIRAPASLFAVNVAPAAEISAPVVRTRKHAIRRHTLATRHIKKRRAKRSVHRVLPTGS
jgi:hypothetical protein